MAIDSVSSRKDKAQKAFSSIDSQRALLSSCTSEWLELEGFFSDLDKAVQQKLSDLSDREKAFQSKMDEGKAALDKREESISAREAASRARVQEQKQSAITALNEEKKKPQEERVKKEGSKVEGAKKSAPAVKVADSPSVGTKSGASVAAASGANGSSKAAATLVDAINQAKIASQVSVRPQLKSLCEKMDGEGLRKFIVDRRKDVDALRSELPSALQNAADPSSLVLKALQGYHTLDLDPSQAVETGASANRRACILLLESLAEVLADPDLGVEYPVVPSSAKKSAKTVAESWRSKIKDDNSLNIQAFLQLLATFGIASEFNDDDLCKFIVVIARRQQTPSLCRSLGLSAKIPGLVEKLLLEGKQIEALLFANAFGIMDTLQPVALLKSYLKDARKAAQSLAKNASTKAAGHNDAAMKEVSALKAVIKAVDDFKLGSKYPTDNLHKRVTQLERERLERKKAAAAKKKGVAPRKKKAKLTPKPESKKPLLSGGGPGLGAPGGIGTSKIGAGRGAGYDSSTLVKGPTAVSGLDRGYYVPTDKGKYSGSSLPSYGLASQVGFERRPEAIYGSSLAGSYNYPTTDTIGSSLLGTASAYSDLSGVYSSYKFGSSLPPPSSGYLSSYLR